MERCHEGGENSCCSVEFDRGDLLCESGGPAWKLPRWRENVGERSRLFPTGLQGEASCEPMTCLIPEGGIKEAPAAWRVFRGFSKGYSHRRLYGSVQLSFAHQLNDFNPLCSGWHGAQIFTLHCLKWRSLFHQGAIKQPRRSWKPSLPFHLSFSRTETWEAEILDPRPA